LYVAEGRAGGPQAAEEASEKKKAGEVTGEQQMAALESQLQEVRRSGRGKRTKTDE
jgi:hypothetical protein